MPLLFIFCTASAETFGQEEEGLKDDRVFRAYIPLGFNASQMHGDDLAGFKKFGLNAGIGTHVMFNDKWSASMEILYSMRGASSHLIIKDEYTDWRKIRLDYAEVPILFNYHDKDIAIFGLGIALGTKVRYKEDLVQNGMPIDTLYNNIPGGDPYKLLDIAGVANVTFLIKNMFGINLRYLMSFTNTGTIEFPESNLKKKGHIHQVASVRLIYYLP